MIILRMRRESSPDDATTWLRLGDQRALPRRDRYLEGKGLASEPRPVHVRPMNRRSLFIRAGAAVAAVGGGLWLKDHVLWRRPGVTVGADRSEEHTSELQSRENLVCRLLLEKKKRNR